VAKRQDKQNQKSLVVRLRYVATPDGEARLSHVIDILLRSAARNPEENINAKKEEKPPCQAPVDDALTGGTEDDSCEQG